MKMKRLLFVLATVVLAFAATQVFFPTPAEGQQVTTFTAGVGTPTLDGVASAGEWTGDSITTSRGVTIKSMMDETNFYMMATWEDDTFSVSKNQWISGAGGWTRTGDEDRVIFMWDMKDAQGQSLNGADGPTCTTMCHPPEMNTSTGRVDIWHWKAHRSNPMGRSDDKYFDTTGRHGDEGSCSEGSNQNEAKDLPASMAPTDPNANLTFLADDLATLDAFDPFSIGNFGSVAVKIPFDNAAVFSDGAVVPGRILSIPTGNRGSVQAAGKWDNGVWTVEFRRKQAGEVDSGGQPEDFTVVPGGSVRFSTEQ